MLGQSQLWFSKITKKFPRISVGLLGFLVFFITFPIFLAEGSKKKRIYDFNRPEVSFYFASPTLFLNRPIDESDKLMVSLFPLEIQKKVRKVIRPVLLLCEKYQLDPFWVLSLMWAESTFRPEVVSDKGARGLMQIMPPTFEETLAEMERKGVSLEADKKSDELKIEYGKMIEEIGLKKLALKLKHLEVGIFYLKTLFDTFDSNHSYATVSYNMGPYWTKMRLKNKAPVGVKNKYLNKILANYFYLTKNLQNNPNVSYSL